MKAVNKFKSLLYTKTPEPSSELFDGHSQLFQPPEQMHESDFEAKHFPQRTKGKREDHFATISSTRSMPDEQEIPDAYTSEPSQRTEPNGRLDLDQDSKFRISPPPVADNTQRTTPPSPRKEASPPG